MSLRINILVSRRLTNAGYCLLWPLIRFRRTLREAGFDIHLHRDWTDDGLTECDLLIVEGRAFGAERNASPQRLLDRVSELSVGTATVWFDNYDSTGLLFADVVPIVRRYWKSQLLRNRSEYLKLHYGGRWFTDYYHRQLGIEDVDVQYSSALGGPTLIGKLRVGWNMGLSDHGRFGRVAEFLYGLFPWDALVRAPLGFGNPLAPREIALSARFGANYSRPTVACQRNILLNGLAERTPHGRIGRFAYRAELKKARAILSPFGWGEICLRDFECFISGAVLIKPDMSGIDTWPAWYLPGKTYFPFDLLGDDLDEVLAQVESSDENVRAVAVEGQLGYRSHTMGDQAAASFAGHFVALVADALGDAPADKRPRIDR